MSAAAESRTHGLSKSRFVAGWKCPRLLWWKVYKADAPEMQPDVGDIDRMEQGTEVGRLARDRYPGGVLIDLPHEQMREKVEATRAALAGDAPAVFEASFSEDGVFVAVDVLERIEDGFRIVEVKATNEVKEEHIPDVAVQVHVLRRAGLDVRGAVLMHLNKEYRHPGPEDLFVQEDVMPQVEALLPEVPGLIEQFTSLLDGPDPGACVGERCGRGDGRCPLDAACWPREPDHIRQLYRVGVKTALKYMARGIHTFGDLPPAERVGETARRQVRAWERGSRIVQAGLSRDLEPFRGRVGFLDFETVGRALPPWPGVKPWQAVPVQFSYHERLDDGTYRHEAWLAEGWGDPRPALAKALVEATAHAERVAMYAPYERTQIRGLAAAVPALSDELADLESRLVDLKKVIQDNIADPAFHGSFSIKDVLTPLVPDLAYAGMEVADGVTASVELAHLLKDDGAMDPAAREAKRAALLEYCKLDTCAMVRLVERMEELAAGA